ncbi:MAG: hypothetical protein KatS3mg042_0268 [Rhodothermaceae bacterium]|nr:MAG: hypothetical protein KatS3mg042_0268 [Rhodothermaceae bacterium]
MPYVPERHHCRSIRLRGYDYTRDGAYFVTLCVRDRVCRFGEVVNGAVRLSAAGRIVAEAWTWLAMQYPYVALGAWVVMPDHVHGIIVMGDGGGSRTARTGDVAGRPGDAAGRRGPVKRKPLGRLIGAFKTVSTKRINEIRGTPGAVLWQRNYYEHVIRDAADLRRIRAYIAANPARWGRDRNNPLTELQT